MTRLTITADWMPPALSLRSQRLLAAGGALPTITLYGTPDTIDAASREAGRATGRLCRCASSMHGCSTAHGTACTAALVLLACRPFAPAGAVVRAGVLESSTLLTSVRLVAAPQRRDGADALLVSDAALLGAQHGAELAIALVSGDTGAPPM